MRHQEKCSFMPCCFMSFHATCNDTATVINNKDKANIGSASRSNLEREPARFSASMRSATARRHKVQKATDVCNLFVCMFCSDHDLNAK